MKSGNFILVNVYHFNDHLILELTPVKRLVRTALCHEYQRQKRLAKFDKDTPTKPLLYGSSLELHFQKLMVILPYRTVYMFWNILTV